MKLWLEEKVVGSYNFSTENSRIQFYFYVFALWKFLRPHVTTNAWKIVENRDIIESTEVSRIWVDHVGIKTCMYKMDEWMNFLLIFRLSSSTSIAF